MDTADNTEAFPEAAAILRDAGWKPHDKWGVYTHGTLVMGLSPDGQHFDVKNTATAPDSPDTPDDPVEAAQWLVRLRAPAVVVDDVVSYEPPREPEPEAIAYTTSLFGEPAEAAYGGEDETHGETGEAADSGFSAEEHGAAFSHSEFDGVGQHVPDDAGPGAGAAGVDPGVDDGGGDISGAFDADFTEGGPGDPLYQVHALLDDADPTPLRGITLEEGADLGAEILDEGQAPQDRFYMGDNLDTMRRERIGAVIEISLDKQAAIWADAGTTEDAYQDLVSAVMHDTNNGVYTGPPERFAQFTALQSWANRAAHVRDTELGFVRFLRSAERPDVEAFDPTAAWPE